MKTLASKSYHAVVIGGGAAGIAAASTCASFKARVALIENHKLGGESLYTGSVPSKALIRSARLAHDLRRHRELGLARTTFSVDLGAVMDRVQEKIADVAPSVSAEHLQESGIDVLSGLAVLKDRFTVIVGDREVKAKNIILALGAAPNIPDIPGLGLIKYLTTESLWDLRRLPRRLIVLGGGPVGCEMAQAFARLGSQVTQVEMLPRLLDKEDPDLSQFVLDSMNRDGVSILTSTKALRVEAQDGERFLICQRIDGREISLVFDEILVAVGRKPNTARSDWKKLGIALHENGSFKVDSQMRTTVKNIFAAGDCVGPYYFTHAGQYQAWHAAMNALFAPYATYDVDYSVLPWCTFTDPELAHVGLSEQRCQEQGIAYDVTLFPMQSLDRAIVESASDGGIKVLTERGKDTILGASIAGHQAGELISVYAMAMKHKVGLRQILNTLHPYPTMMEANRALAKNWTLPRVVSRKQGLLSFLLKLRV